MHDTNYRLKRKPLPHAESPLSTNWAAPLALASMRLHTPCSFEPSMIWTFNDNLQPRQDPEASWASKFHYVHAPCDRLLLTYWFGKPLILQVCVGLYPDAHEILGQLRKKDHFATALPWTRLWLRSLR